MSVPFAVTRHDCGSGVTWLAVGGELDDDTCEPLAARLTAAVAAPLPPSEVVVDLREVEFVSSAGLRALLRGRTAAAARGVPFRVTNATGFVREVLEVTQLIDAFRIGTAVDERPPPPDRPISVRQWRPISSVDVAALDADRRD